MMHKIIATGQVETRRLIWIAALLFALIAALQYFEIPYVSFLSTPASTEKVPEQAKTSIQNGDSNNTVVTEINEFAKDSPSGIFAKRNSTSGIKNGNIVDDDDDEEAREFPEPISDESIGAVRNDSSDFSSHIPATPPAISPLPNTIIPSAKTGDFNNTSSKEIKISHDSEEQRRSPPIKLPDPEKVPPEKKVLDVYSLSDMDDLLIQSQESYYSMVPRWSATVDRELQDAAFQIENAPIVQHDPDLHAPLYRNVSMFKRSYELMEKMLKVYVYKEGERPILHTPVLKGIYASEGWFMKLLESNKQFVTKNAAKAHLFYLPFSSRMLEESLYVVGSHSHKNLIQYLKDYRDMIAAKYPYWNRTGGADHFLVACHDWAPTETRTIMSKTIRAICNSDVKEGFVFGKDVSLPETYVRLPKDPMSGFGGGKPPSKRTILAFFAGSMHGYLRPILLQHWQNKDPAMKIFGKIPKIKNKNKKKKNKKTRTTKPENGMMGYEEFMKSSKYCICAKGYEVNSPRVVEAIFHECVPVIVSDNFVPPFFGVLNWESFAVFVAERDVPDLKRILMDIPEERYLRLYMNVKRVQRHFLWHPKPQKYDIFHMILHSIWFNRLHQIRPRT